MVGEVFVSFFLFAACNEFEEFCAFFCVFCDEKRYAISYGDCGHHAFDGVRMDVSYGVNVVCAFEEYEGAFKISFEFF